ncbi:phage regulator Rha-like protein [Flavobacterium arsenatis]|uniref:Phage regulator Rha-like protein n=1 Tax=Flavobacterium arsenatis TaxID=1484332 RepID=A0ABU1TKV2_9FLAO|nr:ORF6N domain-containing protein [Flavobacterium arsenatis]MDR6966498.1 phage regulator Rha-like protein [Flavobacterium arsenatis]
MDKSIVPTEVIMNKILFIRGQKVMIDRDLAELYGVTTKRLNEQVKRNVNRFPEHFMFQLNEVEKEYVVANCDHLKKLKFSSTSPYVFTEHGTMMLASVLNSEKAVETSIRIIEVFVKMREYFTDNLNLKLEIESIKKKLTNHDKNIELVFNYLDELMDKQDNKVERSRIGYKK